MNTTSNPPSYRYISGDEVTQPAPRRSILDFFTGRNRQTVEQVEQLKANREAEQIKDFVGLAVAFANDAPPPAEQAEAILAEAGKSIEQLYAEVEAYRQFVKLCRDADRLPEFESQRLKHLEAGMAARQRCLELEQEHKRKDQERNGEMMKSEAAGRQADRCRMAKHSLENGDWSRFADYRPESAA